MIGEVEHAVAALGDPESGSYRPIAFWPEGSDCVAEVTSVAERALVENRGVVIAATEGGAEDKLAYPLVIEGDTHGVVALAVESRDTRQLRLAMRQLQWGVAWIEVLLHRERVGDLESTRERATAALDLIAAVLEQSGFSAACTALVTELATRLECDRASIGLLKRRHVQVVAVSHAAEIGKRMDLINAIAEAMDEAIDQETTLVHPMVPKAADIWVVRSHDVLLRRHGAGAVLTVPLAAGDEPVGALMLEREPGRHFDQETVDKVEAIAGVVGPIIADKRTIDRPLPGKVVDSLSRQLERLFGPGHYGRKLTMAGGAALVAFFSIFQTTYRVTADAELEGQVRRIVGAPFDGYIAEELARPGDKVGAGEMLARLDDSDLLVERAGLIADRNEQLLKYQAALGTSDRVELALAEARIQQTNAQFALVERQLQLARLIAPFDGLIVSGDLSQSIGAAVERGQELFEIAPLDRYRVVLMVDERDIDQIAVGQSGYLLTEAFPDQQLPLLVTRITPVSEAGEGQNRFRVEAVLQAGVVETTGERLRPGMEGVGKVEAGERLLIWIWTHRLIDWLRVFFWTWLP